jgi:hypothetical protein
MLERLLTALRGALVLAALTSHGPALAEEPATLSSNQVSLSHFAFAGQLGSGIYTLDGRTLQIYRLPFSWQLAEPRDGRPGVRLRLPATVGLFDFEPGDVVEEGLPEQLDALSLALGVELEFPLGDRWALVPYGEVGRAWNVGEGADYTTYSAAVHARAEYSLQHSRLRLRGGVLWAGVTNLYGQRGDLARAEAGVEGRWPVGFRLAGETADVGTYLLAEWFFDQADEPVLLRSTGLQSSPQQFELGVTFGTHPTARLWRIPLPRVGAAWRFSDGLSVFRLVFGAPF